MGLSVAAARPVRADRASGSRGWWRSRVIAVGAAAHRAAGGLAAAGAAAPAARARAAPEPRGRCGANPRSPRPPGWVRARARPRADADLGAIVVRSRADDGDLGVLRFARTALGARSLRRHAGRARRRSAAPVARRVACRLAPDMLASRVRRRPPVAGRDAPRRCRRARSGGAATGTTAVRARAGAAIRVLHAATATETPVDEAVLRELGRRADRRAARPPPGAPLRAGADHAALDRVRAQLRDELGGRVLTTCFVHGDFWLGNVLAVAGRHGHRDRRLGAGRRARASPRST